MLKKLSSEQARRLYAELGPSLQALLRIRALMGGYCRSLVFDVLTLAGIPAPKASRWSRTDFQAAGNTLNRLGLLDELGRCIPELEHPLALVAASEAAMAGALTRVLERNDTATALPLRFRLAICKGDLRAFSAASDLADRLAHVSPGREHPFAGQFTGDFPALPEERQETAAWFVSLPVPMRVAILHNNLRPLLEEGRTTSFLGTALKAIQAASPGALLAAFPKVSLAAETSRAWLEENSLARFALLGGAFSAVEARFAAFPGSKEDERVVLFPGMAALLQGRVPEALFLLREAQKRLRKRIGKRRVWLHGMSGLCLGLALLLSRDAALQDDLQNLLDAALYLQSPSRKGFMALSALLALWRGQTDIAGGIAMRLMELPVREPLSEAVAWGAALLINKRGALAQVAALEALIEHYREPLPFVALVLWEILCELKDGEEKVTALAGPLQGQAFAHVRFTALVERRAGWERVFDNLARHLCPANGQEAVGGRKPKKKRLIWLLDLQWMNIEPVEQSCKADGVWSKGRVASVKRLYEHAAELDWLDEQDRRVLGAATWSHAWSGPSCSLTAEKALPLLVGHPLLFREEDREPISLTHKSVELIVRQAANTGAASQRGQGGQGGYSLKLSYPYTGSTVSLERIGETAYCLHEFSGPMKEVAGLLGEGELHVPPEGASRVVALLSEHDPSVVVRPERDLFEVVPSIVHLVVQLRPRGTGLDVSLMVRPFGTGEGQAFPPGEGKPEPFMERAGQTCRAVRDLDAEVRAARDLARSCPTLRELGGCGPWLLDDVEAALDCLLELQQSPLAPDLEWPEGESLRVRPALSAASMRVETRKVADWFRLEGEIRVDEHLVLDMGSLLDRLEQAKGCFVPMGEGAFIALTSQFKRQLDRLRRLSESGKDGVRRVHPLGIAAVQETLAEAGALKTDQAWQEQAQRLRNAEAYTPSLPPTLRAELRDYQEEGFVWLARLARWGAGACLADDMGLGKTVQTIAMMLEVAKEGPCLVVAPTSVCSNWEAECLRFAPTLRLSRLSAGVKRERRDEVIQELGPGDVLIVTYGLLHTETASLASRRWRMAVFDEAQALKNAATKRAQAGRKIPADFRVALTGTPIENYLEDLWSLFNIINPGLLGSLASFHKRFSFAGGRKAETADTENGPGRRENEARQALKALVRPFILRRTKSTVLSELPPRTEQTLLVELPDKERAFYEALRRNALEKLEQPNEEGGERRFSILAELTRLRRACCHPSLIDAASPLAGAKLAAFMELVAELVRGGHKALVFSQFVGYLSLVREALDKVSVHYQYLDGSTPEQERRRAVQAFQAGEGDVFLISLRAGGQGLNLTAADYVIHLDPWWNPAVEDQASDRAHRLGQERPVTVYRLVVRGSVEESILRLHRAKRSLAADFLEGAEAPAALNEAELLALIRGGNENL